jgi:trk system potassium uptake protein TrkA
MKVIIAGSGKTLYFLCRNFIGKGYEVTVIDHDKDECVQLARELKAIIIHGDASDSGILNEAGAMRADIILAVTSQDQDNLIICQLAAAQYGTPRVIAMANDPENTDVFRKMGVPAFSTTHIISGLIEQRASLEQIMNLYPIAEGRVNLTEILLESDSPVTGKLLKEIDLPENALVAVVIRDDHPIIPRGYNQLLVGDRVIVITLPENHGSVLKTFTGEK